MKYINMKTYFTKYLPVEGDIKEGDTYTDGIYTRIARKDNPNINGNEKLVKLFLCSRDITSENYLQEEYSRYSDDNLSFEQWFNGNIKWILSLGTFKAIGEISSAALSFIKEGDEFDEDSLAWDEDEKPDKTFMISFNFSPIPEGYKRVIYVKCSCCNKFN